MEHQDFKVVTFNSKSDKIKSEKQKLVEKKISQKVNLNEEVKMEAPKKLGLLISQGRSSKGIKSQKELAALLGVNVAIIKNWENNSVVPSNLEISKIEKTLGVKLPRSKKVKENAA